MVNSQAVGAATPRGRVTSKVRLFMSSGSGWCWWRWRFKWNLSKMSELWSRFDETREYPLFFRRMDLGRVRGQHAVWIQVIQKFCHHWKQKTNEWYHQHHFLISFIFMIFKPSFVECQFFILKSNLIFSSDLLKTSLTSANGRQRRSQQAHRDRGGEKRQKRFPIQRVSSARAQRL